MTKVKRRSHSAFFQGKGGPGGDRVRQDAVCDLAGIGHGYKPRPVLPANLKLMRCLDRLHLEQPFIGSGSRMLRDQLNRAGFPAGRRLVRTLMKRMGIEALYRKPGTSKKRPGHTVYPYLLRGMKIDRANQAWALDTTYIPMSRVGVYLTAVVDWASRKVLTAKIAITLRVLPCC
jgi:putative transposase